LRVWRGKAFYLVGENDQQITQWLVNRFGSKPAEIKFDNAALIWAATPPVPSDYPATGRALRVLVEQAGPEAVAVLEDLSCTGLEKIIALLGFDTANGPALAGVVVNGPVATRHGAREPLTKGFRPNAIPDSIMLARYFGGGKLTRSSVTRADAAWIHGRGQDSRATKLAEISVAFVGCGSIGAPAAVSLAQAGIGRMVLIDFDILTWANIGRHPLGATSVGQFKSKALAARLRADFPHMTVEHHEVDIDTMIRLHPDILSACDLIVSATGSWAADGRLDAWHRDAARRVPIVYAWTEAQACAGHAVLVAPSGGCLRCGFDNTGLPAFRVAAWPNGSPELKEPACGAVFQPYGPVELGFINSLVSELALGSALEEETMSTHRVWAGPGDRLGRLGGCGASNGATIRPFATRADFFSVVHGQAPHARIV
jgi:sulfur-carrier protein adenylyltransferase/sulfurtransferase